MSMLALREFSYWMVHYRRTWRGTVVINLANPLLFLAALGVGLGQLVDRNAGAALQAVPYVAFVGPGLLAATAMQTAVIESGRAFTSLRRRKNYCAAVATPLGPVDVLIGHVLFVALRVGMAVAAFAIAMALFGATSWPLAVLLVPAGLLTGLAFATAHAAWAVTVRTSSSLNLVNRFVVIPLYMFSGTFFPVGRLPEWLQHLAHVTPLWHGVELCRTLSLGTATAPGTALHVGYLAVMATVGFAAARITYRRKLHG